MVAQYSLIVGGGGMQTMSSSVLASTGAPVPLSTTSRPCQMVGISAISTNTQAMFIADSTILYVTTARVGIPVFPGSTVAPIEIPCTDANQVYIYGLSTEAVSYIYYRLSVP